MNETGKLLPMSSVKSVTYVAGCSEVPAIMMSATVSPTLQRQAAELRIKQVLEKPLSNQALLLAIEAELRKS